MVKFKKEKAANVLVDKFDCDWTSKTTAVDAGTNLKDIVGQTLWDAMISPDNKNKYFIKAFSEATAEGTAFHEKIESYNILSASGQYVYFSGATSFTHLRYNDPGNGATVEAILMVNSEGNVRFYVKFDGTLNGNFKIDKIEIHKVL